MGKKNAAKVIYDKVVSSYTRVIKRKDIHQSKENTGEVDKSY